MAPNAERQDFVDDPASSPRSTSSFEEVSFAKAPVIRLPQRETFDEELYYDDESDGYERDLKAKAGDAVAAAKESISRTFERAKAQVGSAYDKVAETSADLSQRAQRQARYMKEEQPLQLLAIIAGTAFAIGVGLRVWRSNRYEQ
jgi:ElaB/YqjD/DUF883 family membrane-anchored ribosome-binding protein